ncbi:MAG: hypothetical protein KKD73_12690 [Proteobacteria bacterium]|nr:hypothetical protein [Pseudomonadota bacterium]MBU1640895.1 hypothetical protein [Pseudomonadota bacterium]
MAEIRSTLEMVLERAARLEAEAGDSLSKEEKNHEGMRLAAQYMRGEEVDLATILAKPDQERKLLVQGALSVLSRNVTLPREKDAKDDSTLAMQGMLQLSQAPQLKAVVEEMKKILSHYLQHKEQLHKQLEEQFAQQIGQLEESMGQKTGVHVKLEPSQHPQFAGEWQKISVQLNDKYGTALTQHKAYIQQLLAG